MMSSQSPTSVGEQTYQLPAELSAQVKAILDDWADNGKVARLWNRDASLWTGGDESSWLGWLDIVREQLASVAELDKVSQLATSGRFKHAVLLGMGGSSLGPEVLRETFGLVAGFPDWLIVDSTDPANIKAVEQRIDYASTLFLVSSKSGSTLEPNIFKDYFFTRACEVLGQEGAAECFLAVTDPGSNLERQAKQDSFNAVYFGKANIGGRYSVLSYFGLVPLAGMGVDVRRFLNQSEQMLTACGPQLAPQENPGVVLGAIMGAAAKAGRDKLTIFASPGIASLGAWMEQLVAESIGKDGYGIIPVDGELIETPDFYGNDRLFAYVRMARDADTAQEAAVAKLEAAGQPVVRIVVADAYDLGQEFFRWEIATAVAGAVVGIHPFDQPDVEASKIETRKLTEAYEASGSLPAEAPFFVDGDIQLFTDQANVDALQKLAGADAGLGDYLRAHLGRLGAGDYFALLAYINRLDGRHEETVQRIRHHIRDHFKVATCVGYGPRFLHSTGQAYKGGPNSGVFLQITCDDAEDLPVPGHNYSFGVVKSAQARGDFSVLEERQRRALRVHLGPDTVAGLNRLAQLICG